MVELPAYWLPRPEPRTYPGSVAAFDRLLGQALEHGPDRPIDYQLGAPKWQFLSHVADRAGMVLHGSADPGIELFEPRQPADPLEFSNRCTQLVISRNKPAGYRAGGVGWCPARQGSAGGNRKN